MVDKPKKCSLHHLQIHVDVWVIQVWKGYSDVKGSAIKQELNIQDKTRVDPLMLDHKLDQIRLDLPGREEGLLIVPINPNSA